MNENSQVEQFAHDVDNILFHTPHAANEQWSETYQCEMKIVQTLATADFSADSQVRQTLKQKLRKAHLGQKDYLMNSQLFQRSSVRLALAAIAIAFVMLAVSPLGASLAQSVVQTVQNWQLGESTTAVSVDSDFEAVPNENGETIILPAPESATDAEERVPEQERERHIILDPTISLAQAQARVTFTLRQPTFVPEGYEFQGVVVGHSWQASLEYVNVAEARLMGLLQTAVGGSNGQVQITFSRDISSVDTAVNGYEALWTQADDEGLLVWEADGVNYQLVGLSDMELALQVAESLE